MASNLNRFNWIAAAYDTVNSIVFGQSIVEAQSVFLRHIKNDSNVLVLGGGTGWILQRIYEVSPDCNVHYIDASSKMIHLSKKRMEGRNGSIHFIHGTEDSIPTGIQFDTVITNFYLDLFTDSQLKLVIEKINSTLKDEAQWIATDFVESKKFRHQVLLRMMYLFFSTSIDAKKLPAWEEKLVQGNFQKSESQTFLKGFITAAVFIKSPIA